MERGIVILKIGGSLVTHKDKPLTPRRRGIETAAKAISEYGKSLVIVHGAGSFGHFLARRHGLSRRPSKAKPEAVSEIRTAVLKLNSLVVNALQSKQVNTYWVQPLALYNSRTMEDWRRVFLDLLRAGVSPLTYGDVIPSGNGFRIISGDEIVRDLAKLLKPDRVVFATDVDGIYRNYQKDDHPLKTLSIEEAKSIILNPVRNDVTGGMRGKLDEAIQIASMHIDVHFTNGLTRERLMKALKGNDPQGTLVKGKMVA